MRRMGAMAPSPVTRPVRKPNVRAVCAQSAANAAGRGRSFEGRTAAPSRAGGQHHTTAQQADEVAARGRNGGRMQVRVHGWLQRGWQMHPMMGMGTEPIQMHPGMPAMQRCMTLLSGMNESAVVRPERARQPAAGSHRRRQHADRLHQVHRRRAEALEAGDRAGEDQAGLRR